MTSLFRLITLLYSFCNSWGKLEMKVGSMSSNISSRKSGAKSIKNWASIADLLLVLSSALLFSFPLLFIFISDSLSFFASFWLLLFFESSLSFFSSLSFSFSLSLSSFFWICLFRSSLNSSGTSFNNSSTLSLSSFLSSIFFSFSFSFSSSFSFLISSFSLMTSLLSSPIILIISFLAISALSKLLTL